MRRTKTSSFITEVELRPSATQAKKLRTKFQCARLLWNAALGEGLRRLRRMKSSPEFQHALALHRTAKERTASEADIAKVEREQAKVQFREARDRYGVAEFALMKWLGGCRYLDAEHRQKTFLGEHIDQKTTEQTAKMVWDVLDQYSQRKRGRPHFRRKHELLAVEGRTGSGCRWKGNGIVWGTLAIPAALDPTDEVQQYGLTKTIKYVRLVRRVIRGRERFYAQLLCEGEPFRKESHRPGEGIVGVDLGPSTIAVVGEGGGLLRSICGELERNTRKSRRLQRAMDRSRRAMNPANFNDNGTVRRGIKLEWATSRRYRRVRGQLENLQRVQAEHRKQIHSHLVVAILKLGHDVRLEQLSYSGWARRRRQKATGHRKRGFGRSVKHHAPGALIARIKTESAKWGAIVTEIETRTTKLSQTCLCGAQQKKSLSEREHRCTKCGVTMQRDLFSAFLARFVSGNKLQVKAAALAWPQYCSLMMGAWNASHVASRRKPHLAAESGVGATIHREWTDDGSRCPTAAKPVTERLPERSTTGFLSPSLDSSSDSEATWSESGADTG